MRQCFSFRHLVGSDTDYTGLSFCFGKPCTTAVMFRSVSGFACYKLGPNFPKEWVLWSTTSGAEGLRRTRRTRVWSSLWYFKKPLNEHQAKFEEPLLQKYSPLLICPGKGTGCWGEGKDVRGILLLVQIGGWQHASAFSLSALPWLFICPETRCLGKIYQPPVGPWLAFKQNRLYLNTCLEMKCKTVFSCQDVRSELFISSAAVSNIITILLLYVKHKGGPPVLSRNRKQLLGILA